MARAPSRHPTTLGRPTVVGTQSFFDDARELVLRSTLDNRELAGAALGVREGEQLVLTALELEREGQPNRVSMDPDWGSVLWHTHPGPHFAAFSQQDVRAASHMGNPLLVLGYGGHSPDLLTYATGVFGTPAIVASLGVKGWLWLERSGQVPPALLKRGIAARVCFPTGAIEPVHRLHGTPLRRALDTASFQVDSNLGQAGRQLDRLWMRVRGKG